MQQAFPIRRKENKLGKQDFAVGILSSSAIGAFLYIIICELAVMLGLSRGYTYGWVDTVLMQLVGIVKGSLFASHAHTVNTAQALSCHLTREFYVTHEPCICVYRHCINSKMSIQVQ